MPLVIIPATLRDFCAGASKLEVPGATDHRFLGAMITIRPVYSQ